MATRQSRMTVSGDTFNAAAVSSTLKPAKKRISTTGGTLALKNDDYGYGPWFEITSTAAASRVSVAISFVDDEGRGGSVTSVAPVSR